jgi:enterochelin esterase-like enzyme
VYSNRNQIVRFAYVSSLQEETNSYNTSAKNNHLKQQAKIYYHREAMFTVRAVNASLPATPPTAPIPLLIASNEREAHGFVPTIILYLRYVCGM